MLFIAIWPPARRAYRAYASERLRGFTLLQSLCRALASGSQTYGSESDFQNFHPHLHVLATDGCFYNDTAFMVCPPPDTGALEKLFRYEVLKMLKAEGKITDVIIENMMNWPPARRA